MMLSLFLLLTFQHLTASVAIPHNEALATTTITLNDGTKIPVVGLGTWVDSRTSRNQQFWKDKELLTTDKSEAMNEDILEADLREEREFKDAVITGMKVGYRHIDSAIVYRTEKVIGEALQVFTIYSQCIQLDIDSLSRTRT